MPPKNTPRALWAAPFVLLTVLAFGQAPPAPSPGAPADGKAFRILDRICKEVDGSVVFTGGVVRSIAVDQAESGAFSMCINCTEDGATQPPPAAPPAAPPAGQGAQGQPPAQPAVPAAQAPPAENPGDKVTAPLGDLLVFDVSKLFKTRLYDGGFLYPNDTGFDADDRMYGAFPVAGPSTETYTVGSLLLVANQLPEKRERSASGSDSFQLIMRRSGSYYVAPIGGSQKPPAKEPDTGLLRGDSHMLWRSHQEDEPDWASRYKTGFLFRKDAKGGALFDSIALFASSQVDFFLVIDLRKLESKQSSYFWAPYRKQHQSVYLDENVLSVEWESGASDLPDEPTTYVEYPYLAILGQYAKIRLTSTHGGPETVVEIGYCERCP